MRDDARAVYIGIEELSVGMFVIIELPWLEHPFTFSSFVVRSDEQLSTIRGLGLTHVRIDPRRGRPPPERMTVPALERAEPPPADAAAAEVPASKARRMEQNRALRASMGNAERKAAKAANVLREVTKRLHAEPAQAIASADALVAEITGVLLGQSEVMIHLLNDRSDREEAYHHSLNVTMLALLLGKALALDAEALRTVGVAAIFHDIGKEDIPYRVLAKADAPTHAEAALLREHCAIGARLAAEAGLSDVVVAAIAQHHEHLDGSGYPQGLAGEQLTPVARLVGVVNAYDNLCNPVDPARALTPYEALSTLFAKRKGQFDQRMLGKLIHLLGVYPPGSIVQLSTGATAMVVSVNPARPLQPLLIVHDPAVPKEEAIFLELEQHPDISISRSIRPASLTRAVYEYLSPRRRTNYYFDEQSKRP